jgi:hypothetical protein
MPHRLWTKENLRFEPTIFASVALIPQLRDEGVRFRRFMRAERAIFVQAYESLPAPAKDPRDVKNQCQVAPKCSEESLCV